MNGRLFGVLDAFCPNKSNLMELVRPELCNSTSLGNTVLLGITLDSELVGPKIPYNNLWGIPPKTTVLTRPYVQEIPQKSVVL